MNNKQGVHQVDRFMRESGFVPHRKANHGTFWRDGFSTILVGRKHDDPRGWQNLLAEIRRAVKYRREHEPAKSTKEEIMKAGEVNGSAPIAKMGEVLIRKSGSSEVKHVMVEQDKEIKNPKIAAMMKNKTPRLDPESRKVIMMRVEELMPTFPKAKHLADRLKEEKFTHPNGKEISAVTVMRMMKEIHDARAPGRKRMEPAPIQAAPPVQVAQPAPVEAPHPAPSPAHADTILAVVLEILKRPDWSAEKKVRVLLAVAEP